MASSFFESGWWTWLVLPLLILLSRILDQTIGTLRLIFVSKGFRHLAPALGFFEVIIWLLAVTQVLQHLTNPIAYVAYGAGFAVGNYLGILLEERLSLGNAVLRIIPRENVAVLVERLRAQGFGVTTVDAMGVAGPVQLVFTILRRKAVPLAVRIVHEQNPRAFYTIEEVKAVKEGYFGERPREGRLDWRRRIRKSK